jgi:hypothetical protein
MKLEELRAKKQDLAATELQDLLQQERPLSPHHARALNETREELVMVKKQLAIKIRNESIHKREDRAAKVQNLDLHKEVSWLRERLTKKGEQEIHLSDELEAKKQDLDDTTQILGMKQQTLVLQEQAEIIKQEQVLVKQQRAEAQFRSKWMNSTLSAKSVTRTGRMK